MCIRTRAFSLAYVALVVCDGGDNGDGDGAGDGDGDGNGYR